MQGLGVRSRTPLRSGCLAALTGADRSSRAVLACSLHTPAPSLFMSIPSPSLCLLALRTHPRCCLAAHEWRCLMTCRPSCRTWSAAESGRTGLVFGPTNAGSSRLPYWQTANGWLCAPAQATTGSVGCCRSRGCRTMLGSRITSARSLACADRLGRSSSSTRALMMVPKASRRLERAPDRVPARPLRAPSGCGMVRPG